MLGTDGGLYGTTVSGGAFSDICRGPCGTVFKITSSGTLTTLHSFDLTDGDAPYGGLVQATNGIFYGTTQNGGSHGQGTIFSLSTGLGPFVETNPAFGRVGTSVIILGNNLTGTTAVTFNGTAASFKVVSNSAIKTSVPIGATTGTVQVTTPIGTLNSNIIFRVVP